ncbi:MAG: cell surface protein, partial [Deltaproteobacteria bacterium]|nr:cell surface protein [Nannocystaceae bacterium]
MNGLRLVMLGLVLPVACTDDEGAGDDTIVAGEPVVAGSCADDLGHDDAFADCIDAIAPAPGIDFGHDQLPDIVLGPPLIAAPGMGSLDVASLGCGGRITLAFDPPGIEDGDGVDLLVFENAFTAGTQVFAEPAQVLVSD